MDLHYSPLSPPCWSVLMLARQMNLPLNLKLVNFGAKGSERDALVKLNPVHKVPTLVDGDFSVGESRTILSYLVEAHGKPADQQLLPRDPKARALVQFRLDFDLSMLYQRSFDYCAPIWKQKIAPADLSKDDRQKVHVALGFLEEFLTNSRYVAGDHLTVADISIVSSITLLMFGEMEGFDKFPKVMAWYETCKKELVGYDDVITNQKENFRKFLMGK